MNREIILEVDHLIKHFRLGRRSVLKAVDDVSFNIYKGETLGLVGESGCGKTTCGRTCIGLYPKTGGCVLYKGQDVHNMDSKRQRKFTSEVQTIFQDPYSSLNPRMTVAQLIAEPLRIHKVCTTAEEESALVSQLMETVGLADRYVNTYPHEMDGGRRQRVGIARA